MSRYSATATAVSVSNGMHTLLEVNPPANRVVTIKEIQWSFSGTASSDAPVLMQVGGTTAASSAGTAVTPRSLADGQVTVGAAAKSSPSTEGTFTTWLNYQTPPTSGYTEQFPLGFEPQVQGAAASAKGFAIRGSAVATVNAEIYIIWDE